jgi:alkanesulfonate monooxygenase SsuD/methylene tetrahydromethanopterin reductase-like flavin-dependent oxidoreductase (luciferase family)
MKLSLFYEFDVAQPWAEPHPWGQRMAERRTYRDNIEQIVLADRLGFDTVWCVEHHFREGRSHMPCNDQVLAALSQITRHIKLGYGVSLAPHEFIHPVRLAEKVATTDLLSQGRVQWGLGRSTPMEQIAFGVDIERSKDKLRAAARTVCNMWSEEFFEEHSEFLDFPKRMITPKPYQYPHPPVWQATGGAAGAASVGAAGLGVLLFTVMDTVQNLKANIDAYREAQKTAVPVTDVVTNQAAAFTLVHCVEDRAQLAQNRIWDSIGWWYTHLVEFARKWENDAVNEAQRKGLFHYTDAIVAGKIDASIMDEQDMVIVGTPDECLRKFLRYEEAGADQLACYVAFGHVPHEAVMRSLELLAKHVMPELEKRGAQRAAEAIASSVRAAERRAV